MFRGHAEDCVGHSGWGIEESLTEGGVSSESVSST